MDSEPQGVRNKGMLLVSFILAVLVVVIYNLQSHYERQRAAGEKVYLLAFNNSKKAGEKIEADDLSVREVRKEIGERIGDIVVLDGPEEKMDFVNWELNRPVSEGDWLLFTHIRRKFREPPSAKINKDENMVAFPLELATREGYGQFLREGDQVNVIGRVALPGKGLQSYRILEGVRVLSVAGMWTDETSRYASARRRPRSYRTILIEIPREEDLILNNVLSHVVGGVVVTIMNPEDEPMGPKGKVNPVLRDLKAAAGRYGPTGPAIAP
jgi:Flp pilus assembly protein CpaB